MGFIALNAVLLGAIVCVMEETADLDWYDLFGAAAISLAAGFGRVWWLGADPAAWQVVAGYGLHGVIAGVGVSACMGMSLRRATVAAVLFIGIQALVVATIGGPSTGFFHPTRRW